MRFRSIARVAFALTVIVAGVAPFATMEPAAADPVPYEPALSGYWSVDAAGRVRSVGDAPHFGDLRGVHLNAPIVDIAAYRESGYWLVAADGGVFTFGAAPFYGSAGNLHLNAPIVGMLPWGREGYLLAAADGGVFTYGDAKFHGSAGGMHLNAPIVGIAWVDNGYVLAASDGGVFTFGGAPFLGSAGNLRLNAPIVGIASTHASASGAYAPGYVLAASDGGVFTYGGAVFSGTSTRLPVSAVATTEFGGYVLQSAADGSLSTFGNAGSCEDPLPPSSLQRFVGVAAAFSRRSGDVEGGMAQVSCPGGGHTGTFHAPTFPTKAWRVEVNDPPTPRPCLTEVFGLDRVGNQPVPARLVAKYGRVVMRSTQTRGHRVFDVKVTGTNCRAVATNSVFSIWTLPVAATTRVGDIGPFGFIYEPGNPPSPPFIVNAHGTCTTEVRASSDGHLIQRKSGGSYTMTVQVLGFWITNSPGCTVSVS